jgi:phage-related tail protein
MTFDGIDTQIERYTKKINEITEKLKDPNLKYDTKKKLESELTIAKDERTKWKIRKNNQFTTRHKKPDLD